MKKNVLVYGLISGVIVSALMAVNVAMCMKTGNYDGSMVVGYAAMLIALSMIFVGVKNYRDKYNNGVIGFGKAFTIGLLISLVASTIYVAVWLVEEHFFYPDFIEKYSAHELAKLQSSGVTGSELVQKTEELKQAKEWYANPFLKVLMTYAEILPVGIVVSLISALFLRRKGTRRDSPDVRTAAGASV